MTAQRKSQCRSISNRFVRTVCERINAEKRVRRTLPLNGRVHLDRPVPFLCVYKRPLSGEVDGTDRLVTGQPSYIIASADKGSHPELASLVEGISSQIIKQFGAILVVNIRAENPTACDDNSSHENRAPFFRIRYPKQETLYPAIDSLADTLRTVKVAGQAAQVELAGTSKKSSLFHGRPGAFLDEQSGIYLLDLEVRPIYWDAERKEVYPLVLRELRRGLTRALGRLFYDFSRACTTHQPAHFHVLGRRAVVKAVWAADRILAETSQSFDTLLLITPTNSEAAWRRFQANKLARPPQFQYRPLAVSLTALKRKLFSAPIDRIEDPALADLMREKQVEVDRLISMLQDRNTKRFLYGSMQVFGVPDNNLVALSGELLDRLPRRAREDSREGHISPNDFLVQAQDELAHYAKQLPSMIPSVELRDDIGQGLMVSAGRLLISSNARIPKSRADSLLQHEVGTHVLTYWNGRAQPLRQLCAGLAGYEELQEGLAVLGEYLAGGLSRPRLRVLAARVLAVNLLVDGASFVDVFRVLKEEYGFEKHTAFNITMRVFRAGGTTKDAVYLKGFCKVLDYLGTGGDIKPLFVGKIALKHVPVIRELLWRQVLIEPPLSPRFLSDPQATARLETLRNGVSVLDLIGNRT